MEDKILEILKELTLEEKIGMIHGDGLFQTKGVERLGIPPLKMSDGPMGVRCEFENGRWIPSGSTDDYVTYLPSNSAVASTWNRDLARLEGRVLGAEARGRGKDVILAPGINIKRSPLCGRNFEYMSEDPCLTAEVAVPLIQGIQESDVASCVKHFAVNSQETERLWVETLVGDRALWEIYLPAFEHAVSEGGAFSIMGAYNLLRGEHCCQSPFLLKDILRKQWGYDGCVISDWGAVHDTKKAAEGGLDVEMSVTDNFNEYFMAEPLKKEIEEGRIDESVVDEKIKNILRLMFRLNMLGGERKSGAYNTPAHREAALNIARESVVLLKNEYNRLPLKRESLRKLLVVGENAARIHSNGGGSAEIKALYEISPLMGLKSQLGGNVQVDYVRGYDSCTADKTEGPNWQETSLEGGGGAVKQDVEDKREVTEHRRKLRQEAAALAGRYDDVIFIGGLNHDYDLEGQDRKDMKLPYGQDEVIEALLEANPNTVIVMTAGSPVEMHRWADKAKAIVWNWYAGMEGGNALAEVLLGKTNPSGRLPETFPVRHTDCPAHCIGEFPGGRTVDYREGVYVGYRYYDTENITVQFPFGHGLSYTSFKYEDIKIHKSSEGGSAKAEVKVRLKNTGKYPGKETVQLYVSPCGTSASLCSPSAGACSSPASPCSPSASLCSLSAGRPVHELKGFEKAELAPGECTEIRFTLTERDFSYYNENKGSFVADPGRYEIKIGSSSRDIRLRAMLELD